MHSVYIHSIYEAKRSGNSARLKCRSQGVEQRVAGKEATWLQASSLLNSDDPDGQKDGAKEVQGQLLR